MSKRKVEAVPVKGILAYMDEMAKYPGATGEHHARMAKTVRALKRVEKAADAVRFSSRDGRTPGRACLDALERALAALRERS